MHDLIQYFLVLPIFKKSMNNPSIFCDKPVISPPIFSGQRKIGISLAGSLRVQWGPDRLQLEITGDETKKKGKKKADKIVARKERTPSPIFSVGPTRKLPQQASASPGAAKRGKKNRDIRGNIQSKGP